MRVQLRIVAGVLRGRRLTCNISPDVRPTPDRVREALFNILGNAVPDRPFVDVFAGSGVVGLEALSRGAGMVTFLERDLRQAQEIERHLREFGLAARGRVLRADVYRWAETWQPPSEPVNVFLSPPFADLEHRPEQMVALVQQLQAKLPFGSVLVLQSEKHAPLEDLPVFQDWERRRYGRNVLLIWEPESQESGVRSQESGISSQESGMADQPSKIPDP